MHNPLLLKKNCLAELRYVTGLRPLGTLDNFEFNRVPFIKNFVALAYDARVVDKYVWTVLAPDEAVTFRVIEPLDCAVHRLWS